MKDREMLIGRKKNIALVAHDNRKRDLLNWIEKNRDGLKGHQLSGTGTTASLIEERVGLEVRAYKSGPLGGDLQIGSRIAEGEIDLLIFFWDPLEAQPHDPDIKALLRISVLYNIPIANNEASADFILSSSYMDQEYGRRLVDYGKSKEERLEGKL